MSPLETIIATTIASVFAGMLSLYLSNRKQRQLEAYKANLQAQLEHAKLQTQNDLQIKFFEYQTRFSTLHQRQAEVINELYGLLGQAHEYIIHMVSPFFDPNNSAHVVATTEKYNLLAECFVKNRIYLDEATCKGIDDLLPKLKMAMTKASLGHQREPGGHKSWGEAWDSVRNDVPPILKDLETQFRALLSPRLETDAQQSLDARRGSCFAMKLL
jgi:hypothetical protein